MVEEDIEFVTFDGDTITKSDYRDEIINKYITANLNGLTKITDFSIGSEAYHLADVIASLMLEHRELIDLNYRMSMIHTAEGEFLDNFGDMVGVHRYGSSPSEGEVTFTRLNTEINNTVITIPDGMQISTEDAISFVVDNNGDNLILESGVNSITANIICEQDGAYTNVLPNTITLIMNELASLLSVTNVNSLEGGRDIEEDDEYRSRILLSPYEAPTGTLQWYENTALTLSSIHDVRVEKGATQLDDDIIIIFNPMDWTSTVVRQDINQYNEDNSVESTSTGVMTTARADLVDLFNMKEYDIAGITLDYNLCEKVPVLNGDATHTYYFAVLLDNNYTINMVKTDIINKINQFNSEANISNEFNPSSLAILIENEVTGVNNCRIVKYNSNNQSYTEIVEPVSMEENELYSVDLTNITNRIRIIQFNIDIEEVE